MKRADDVDAIKAWMDRRVPCSCARSERVVPNPATDGFEEGLTLIGMPVRTTTPDGRPLRMHIELRDCADHQPVHRHYNSFVTHHQR